MRKTKIIIAVLIAALLLAAGVFLLQKIQTDADIPDAGNQSTQSFDDPVLESFPGDRDPWSFTWADYQQLTPEEQAAFPDWFESLDAFKSWYDAAYSAEIENAAGVVLDDGFLGGRDPESLTWEEYQQLTPEQQAQLPDYFESLDAFDRWYASVCPAPTEPEAGIPTQSDEEEIIGNEDFLDGRDPADFTWAEYQQLTPDQQAVFPDFFESLDAFDIWYSAASAAEQPEDDEIIEDEDFLNGRTPADFTWEEYQQLTPDQQAVFPDFFESYDAFLDWKDENQPG